MPNIPPQKPANVLFLETTVSGELNVNRLFNGSNGLRTFKLQMRGTKQWCFHYYTFKPAHAVARCKLKWTNLLWAHGIVNQWRMTMMNAHIPMRIHLRHLPRTLSPVPLWSQGMIPNRKPLRSEWLAAKCCCGFGVNSCILVLPYADWFTGVPSCKAAQLIRAWQPPDKPGWCRV